MTMLAASLALICCLAGLVSAAHGENNGTTTTCESLRNLTVEAEAFNHLGVPEVCNTTDGCLGLQCTTHSFGGQTYTKVVLLPCQRPRAIRTISVFNDIALLDEVVNQSKVFDYTILGLPLRINLTFEDRNDSVLLGAEAISGNTGYTILPLSPIPIDDDLCNENGTVTTQTPPPPTLPTSPTQPETACDAADLIAAEVPKQFSLPIFDATDTCERFQNCTGVHCLTQNQFDTYEAKLYFLPCQTPPAVRLVVDDSTGAVHIDRIIDRNRTSLFGIARFLYIVRVTLIHQQDGSMLFALSVHFLLFELSIEFVPLTTIPVDRSSCPTQDSCVVWGTIADDLDALVRQRLPTGSVTDVCNRYDNCSGVACTLSVTIAGSSAAFNINLEVLLCLNPPAIHLVFADNSGNKIYDRNFDKSAEDSFSIPSAFFTVNVTLNVTVIQVPGALDFALGIIAPTVGKMDLIPLTEIPVNSSACPTGPPIAGPTGKGPTGPPPTATPDTQTGGIQASAVAGITLGVIILVALLLIATVIGFTAVWWVYRRRTKSARATVSFATKDYTDETNVTDLDDMVGESV